MSLPFLNTAPGYDEELRNSVFFERGLHATSICGAVGAAVAVAMLQGQDGAGIASAAGIAASMGAGLLEANRTGGPSSASTPAGPRAAAWQRPTWPGTGSPARRPCWRAASGSCRRSAATAPTRTPSSAAWARTGRCRAWSSSRTRATTSPTRAWTPPCGCAGARPRRRHSDRAGRRQARPAHDRRATRGQGTAGLRVPRGVQRPLHGRRGAARRRPRRVPRGLHRRRRP
jgi:hypothetical protein